MATRQGMVALVGSGEFLPVSEPLDRLLLEWLGEAARVVVLPTASAPDGPGVPERWAKLGIEHFTRLGAVVEPVMALTRADTESAALAERIAAANVVYLSGGKPGYLLDTLRDTTCWRAIVAVHAAGGIVAGCSAGAMALAGRLVGIPLLQSGQPALGLVPDLAVIPHFDELPRWLSGLGRLAARRAPVAGVEGATALVVRGEEWSVAGRGGVTLFAGRRKRRYVAGERIER
jgi:cyanophycinase